MIWKEDVVQQPISQKRTIPFRVVSSSYALALSGFILCVILILLTVVDMRRAFLLPSGAYSRLGSPSAFLSFTPGHLVVLALSLAAAWLAYRAMSKREHELWASGADLRGARTAVAIALMLALIVDLFIYRSVQAARTAEAGRLGISKTFAVDAVSPWIRPVAEAANFLLVVWHATLLGILIGALMLTLLCSTGGLKRLLSLTGLPGHLAGSATAVAYPFCSCCAGPVGASLYRGGASLNATMAFVVAAPLLNVTTLFLAVTLLPADFALLRILGGVALSVFGTLFVARLMRGRIVVGTSGDGRRLRLLEGFYRLFAFEQGLEGRAIDTPAALIGAWLRTAWAIGRVAVPTLFVAAALVGWLAPILLSLGGGNDFATVFAATAIGTLFMIPTWSEIAVTLPLIERGLTGPAAALLLTLPATSLPSLAIFGAALPSWRIPALMAAVVFLTGIIAGALFL